MFFKYIWNFSFEPEPEHKDFTAPPHIIERINKGYSMNNTALPPYRKLILLLIMMTAFINQSFAQPAADYNNLFKNLQQKGFTFGVSESLEGYRNFKGGIRKGNAYASTFDANLTVDLKKTLGLNHGIFYIDFEDHAGNNPTSKLTGDAQVFDKHTSDPFFQTMEIWYQQQLFKNKLRIKLGKIDANSEYSVIDNGLDFINSSTQVTPTLFVFPTFPDPMPGVNLFFTPSHLLYTKFAVFDANQHDRFLNFYGEPSLNQPSKQGSLLISESGLTWNTLPVLHRAGNLKIGLWDHNGTFTTYNGSSRKNAQGIYLIFDQTVWQPPADTNNNRGISVFLEYGQTEASLNPVSQHAGGGIVWKGLTESRPDDDCGLSIQYGSFGSEFKIPDKYELDFETFYNFSLADWLNIKPDMQYIINPGGLYPNAYVGTLVLNFSMGT